VLSVEAGCYDETVLQRERERFTRSLYSERTLFSLTENYYSFYQASREYDINPPPHHDSRNLSMRWCP